MPLVDPLLEVPTHELADLIQVSGVRSGLSRNSVWTMQRGRKLPRAFTELTKALMENGGRVTAEQRRLIGFVPSHAPGCRYCEAHTILAAERFGASAERMNAVWDYASSPLFTAAEKAAFDFALAAASSPNAVTLEISAALKAHWTDDEIIEILGVVALFGFLNRWNDSMGTTLEPIGVAAGEKNLAAHGWTRGKHG